MAVPAGLRTATDWTWRLLVLSAGIWLLWQVMTALSQVLIPLFLAVLLAAALWPLAERLVARRVPRGIAAGLCLLLLGLIVAIIFGFVGSQIASQWTQLGNEAKNSYHQFMNWLADGPLGISHAQVDVWMDKATAWAKGSQSQLAGYATSAGTGVSHFAAGIALALFALFYFLYEGRSFARMSMRAIPVGVRPRVADAFLGGWHSLVAYVRAAVIVAFVDGLGAGLGALLIGSNLWLAIFALTFITAFVPLLGALTAGLISTAVVLVTLGWVKALIMLAIFTAVMQLEGHVLQPFLLGRAVAVHPLAVLYGLAIGMIVGGIVGGLFAVPIMAFGNAFLRSLSHVDDDPEAAAVTP